MVLDSHLFFSLAVLWTERELLAYCFISARIVYSKLDLILHYIWVFRVASSTVPCWAGPWQLTCYMFNINLWTQSITRTYTNFWSLNFESNRRPVIVRIKMCTFISITTYNYIINTILNGDISTLGNYLPRLHEYSWIYQPVKPMGIFQFNIILPIFTYITSL